MDIPGAYLHTHTPSDKEIIMLMKGKLAEMIVLVNPKLYCKYIIYDTKSTPILYVKMNKALYGLLQSALLWYKKLTEILKTFGFR